MIRYVLTDTGEVIDLDWLGFSPTLIVFRFEGALAVMDNPDDEIETEGEQAALYRYAHHAMLDYRGRDRENSGWHGFYHPVPKGEYECTVCGAPFASPPRFPYVWCTERRSGMHVMADLTPEEQREAFAAHLEVLKGGLKR